MKRLLLPLKSATVLLTMVAVLFAVLLFLGWRTYGELERQRAGPTDSTQWMIFQTSLEFNRLNSAYAQYVLSASPANQKEFITRFDIFYSRLNTLRNSKAFERLRDQGFFVQGTQAMSRFVEKLAGDIDQGRFDELRSNPEIAGSFQTLERNVAGFVTSAVQTQAAWDVETRSALKRLLVMQLATTGLVLLAFLYFAFVVLQQRNQALTREEQLRESRDLLGTTVKSSLDGVLIADAAGNVVDVNDAAAGMFGYSAAEMFGKPMAGLIIPERMRGAHEAGMERYTKTGKAKVIGRRIELDAMRKDGSEFPVELSISSSGKGPTEQYVAFMRDITERRMAEETLKNAKDRAEAASRAKAQFLAAISHEMRTPLTGILGALDLIDGPDLSERQRKYVQTANRSGHALLSVISDVLDISRLEAGKVDLEIETLDLRTIVDDVVEIVSQLAGERGNRVQVHFDANLPGGLTGDPARIRQVLLNLATNAVKFTYNGTVDISVMLLWRDGNRAEVEFAVKDTGPGIAEEDKNKLFKNFSQLGNADAAKGGSGLGLAISNRLVDIMSGVIGLDSELGKGSRFWFRLPLDLETQPAPAYAGGAAMAGNIHSAPPKSVLVVDDNETVRTIIAGQLASRGHSAETVDGAVKAIEILKRTSYDAVILDISMPVMDGFEALRIIRSMPGRAGRTPVIALTAHALLEDRERCIAAGFDQFLTKPVRAAELDAAIADVTSRQAGEGVDQQASPATAAEDGRAPLFALHDLTEQFVSVAPADLRRIIDRFGSELDQQMGLLRSEGSDISPHHLRRIVHVLAGSASMIGAKRLALLAGRLDALATHQQDQELVASVVELVATISETRRAVDEALGALEAKAT